jgi:hypothetical protein
LLPFAPILADGDDSFVKVIIGIVVFVIWGIGALANMAKKQGQASQRSQMELEQAMREQMEEARRRQMADALEEMRGPAVPPPPMMRPIPPPPPVPAALQRPRPRGPVIPPMRPHAQVPIPQAVRRPVPAVPPMRPSARPQQRKAQKRRPVPAVPVPMAERVVPVEEHTPAVLVSEIGQGTAPARPSRRAAEAAGASSSILKLTPQTLRQLFILTEILQPPLALRERPLSA